MNEFTRCIVLALLAPFAGVALGQGQVWIVDPGLPPPLADFNDIQSAVDAASDNDAILVRSGSYPGFTVDGKSLVIAEDIGASASAASGSLAFPCTVENLGPQQQVVIQGIDMELSALNCQGTVWIEGFSGLGLFFGGGGRLKVGSCDSVVVVDCMLASPFGSSTAPEHGLEAFASNVTVYESRIEGNYNGGGDGCRLLSSFLFASGSHFEGGKGTDGFDCIGYGNGGDGLVLGVGSEARLLETTLAGGKGGFGGSVLPCGGAGGVPILYAGGTMSLVAGYARDYVLSSPATGATTLTYAGKPGDIVFSLIAVGTDYLWLPQLAGALVLPIPPMVFLHGPTDPSGGLTTSIPLPPLPPGTEAFTAFAQGAAVSITGQAVLAAPTFVTIL